MSVFTLFAEPAELEARQRCEEELRRQQLARRLTGYITAEMSDMHLDIALRHVARTILADLRRKDTQ
jgi:hypothetical protein